jgi:heme/copper-type cytochrome/quinol oxidase subunit 2
MSEIITIVDPGWDWFQFSMFMIAPAVLLVLAILFAVLSRFQSSRDTAETLVTWAGGTGAATLVVLLVAAAAAGITGSVTYSGHQDDRILEALNENGQKAVSLVDADGQIDFYITEDGSMGSIVHADGDRWRITEPVK